MYKYIVRDFGVFTFVLFKQVHVYKYRIKLQKYVLYLHYIYVTNS